MTARIKKVKRKKIRPCFKVLVFSFLVYFLSRTILGSINVTLGIEYQKNQEKILELSKIGETLRLDVQSLSSFDRIKAIVDSGDFTYNQDNAVNVNE